MKFVFSDFIDPSLEPVEQAVDKRFSDNLMWTVDSYYTALTMVEGYNYFRYLYAPYNSGPVRLDFRLYDVHVSIMDYLEKVFKRAFR